MSKIIRVMIADDYEIIRQGIKRVLDFEEDLKVIAEAEDGRDVLNQVSTLKPDVLLLDMSMPYHDGMTLLKEIKTQELPVKVIMLTVESGAETINKAIEYGADGYVVKESTTAEIVEAIHAVHDGNKYLDKSLMHLMFQKYSGDESNVFSELSQRELEILYYVSKGFSNKDVAKTLFLSEKTIKNNLTRIFKKLDVKDRVHAAILAITHKIEDYYKE